MTQTVPATRHAAVNHSNHVRPLAVIVYPPDSMLIHGQGQEGKAQSRLLKVVNLGGLGIVDILLRVGVVVVGLCDVIEKDEVME